MIAGIVRRCRPLQDGGRKRETPHLSPTAIYKIIMAYAKEVGIFDQVRVFNVHSLRTTAANNARNHGATLDEVQAWMGHKDISTTRKHYVPTGYQPENSPTFARGRKRETQHLSPTAIYKIIMAYAKQVGIFDQVHAFNVHSLRTTAANNARNHGAALDEVQAWMGHKDISTTRKHYVHTGYQPENSPTFKVDYHIKIKDA